MNYILGRILPYLAILYWSNLPKHLAQFETHWPHRNPPMNHHNNPKVNKTFYINYHNFVGDAVVF